MTPNLCFAGKECVLWTSDGIRDMVSRGPLALHQPEALNAAVCLGVQLGRAPGAEEEAGAHAALAKGIRGDCHPATCLFPGLWGPEVSPLGAELTAPEFSEGLEISCGTSSLGWRVGWFPPPPWEAD